MADKNLKQAVVDIYDPSPVPSYSQIMLDVQDGSGMTSDERGILRSYIAYIAKFKPRV